MLSLLWTSAYALDGSVSLTSYHHDIWTAKDGAPSEVMAIAQTADGWLWLGSPSGLYRFDGIRFRRFEPLRGEPQTKRAIAFLTSIPSGGLLIGFQNGGVSLLLSGQLTSYPNTLRNTTINQVSSAIIDQTGLLWATTSLGLLSFRNGRWDEVGTEMGIGTHGIANLTLDQYGSIWLTTKGKLMVLPRSERAFHTVLPGISVKNLSASADGRFWASKGSRLIAVPSQHLGQIQPRPYWLTQSRGQDAGLFDQDGNFWTLACPVGVCRATKLALGSTNLLAVPPSPEERLDQPWQVSRLSGTVLFEDRDANVWMGTQEGVERFRENRIGAAQLQTRGRSVSFAKGEHGNAFAFLRAPGELWRLLPNGKAKLEQVIPDAKYGSIASTKDGAILIARSAAIEKRWKGRVEQIPYPTANGVSRFPSVENLADDGSALWLTLASGMVFKRENAKWTGLDNLGLAPGPSFLTAGSVGEMWFGYKDGSVAKHSKKGLTKYDSKKLQDIGAITFVHAGRETIIGGEDGLSIQSGATFRKMVSADPDVLSSISGMAINRAGDRWFNGSRGIVFVTANDWRASVVDRVPLKYNLIGILDGYPGRALTENRSTSAIGSLGGGMWFLATGGLTFLDFSRPRIAQRPPAVKLESLVSQGKRYADFSDAVVLPAGTTSFRMEYTALSYVRPETVRFRYRLKGVDSEWQEAGTRRAITYSNLNAGAYRFSVEATNDEGSKNPQSVSITVRILPTFKETPLFYGLCVFALAALIYVLDYFRLKHTSLRLGERIAERERIARALHDTFLQSLHCLILKVHSTLAALPENSEPRQRMESALGLAEGVMEEGRDQVRQLRAKAMRTDDLPSALGIVASVMQEGYEGNFALHAKGPECDLEPTICDGIYRIGREALMNAFKHSYGTLVIVELNYGKEYFELIVSDDGRGIPTSINTPDGLPGHWGLPGMSECARSMGGRLAIESSPLYGTRVCLLVPAGLAYTSLAWKRPWTWLVTSLRPHGPNGEEIPTAVH